MYKYLESYLRSIHLNNMCRQLQVQTKCTQHNSLQQMNMMRKQCKIRSQDHNNQKHNLLHSFLMHLWKILLNSMNKQQQSQKSSKKHIHSDRLHINSKRMENRLILSHFLHMCLKDKQFLKIHKVHLIIYSLNHSKYSLQRLCRFYSQWGNEYKPKISHNNSH